MWYKKAEDYKKMRDWFDERTNKHIERVQKYCRKIEDYDPRFDGLVEQAKDHDKSKFEDPEIEPYVYVTWQYKCKEDGTEFEAPEGMDEQMNKATNHHVLHNAHHPEKWSGKKQDVINRGDRDKPLKEMVDVTKMPDLALGEMCFTGDTKISLLSGKEIAIKDLVGKDKFWVYSCDINGDIVPGLARNARKTKSVSKLCEVTIDNKEVIRCTPEHKFMVRDGSYKEAKDLKPNDRLMPLYRRISRKRRCDYEEVYSNAFGQWVLTHRMVVDKCLGGYRKYVKLLKTNKLVCHHKNVTDPNNKRNNDPSNLQIMSVNSHHKMHFEKQKEIGSNVFKKLWKNKDFIEAQKTKAARIGKVTGPRNLTIYNKSEEHKKTASRKMSQTNRIKMACSICNKPFGNIGALTTHLKCTHNVDPEYRAKRSILASEIWKDSKYKAKMAKLSSIRANTPVVCNVCGKICGNIASLGNHNKFSHKNKNAKIINHRVVSVKIVNKKSDVYDITVDGYHNFALSSGIFVHNCADWFAMSEEKNSHPKDWADKNVNKRWKFTDEQKDLIYELIEGVWNK